MEERGWERGRRGVFEGRGGQKECKMCEEWEERRSQIVEWRDEMMMGYERGV